MKTACWSCLILALAGCRPTPPAAPPSPFRVAAWQWHAPFRSIPGRLDIDEVYVRAATLSFDGERLTPVLPQRFEAGEKRPVHLVLNFDGGATRHFGELPEAEVASVLTDTFQSARAAAARKGLSVRGLQLDLDCPARLLPRYAAVCRALKGRIPGVSLSVTGLVSWLDESGLDSLVKEIDLFVPQFYEGRLPDLFDQNVPVSDHERYEAAIPKLERLARPYRVGIAAYGQALLFDAAGKRVGVYRGLSVAEAFRHPSLRLDSIRDVHGERHVRFRAVRPDERGRGAGYGILYRLPTPESFSAALAAARTGRPANCLGAAVFRLAEEGETGTLPIATLTAVLDGRRPVVDVRRDVSTRANPYALIEGTAQARAEDVRVAIRNHGDAPHLSAEPLRVDVRFPAGCADVISVDRADRYVTLGAAGEPANVSLHRSSGIRFERAYVGVGERVDLGTVRLKPGCSATITTSSP